MINTILISFQEIFMILFLFIILFQSNFSFFLPISIYLRVINLFIFNIQNLKKLIKFCWYIKNTKYVVKKYYFLLFPTSASFLTHNLKFFSILLPLIIFFFLWIHPFLFFFFNLIFPFQIIIIFLILLILIIL